MTTTTCDPTCDQLVQGARDHAAALRSPCTCANFAFKCAACPRCVAIAWLETNLAIMAAELGAAQTRVSDLQTRVENQAQWLSYPNYDLHAPIAEAYAAHVQGGSSTGSRKRFGEIVLKLEAAQHEVTAWHRRARAALFAGDAALTEQDALRSEVERLREHVDILEDGLRQACDALMSDRGADTLRLRLRRLTNETRRTELMRRAAPTVPGKKE